MRQNPASNLAHLCFARSRLAALALVASFLLSACGGGGGGSEPPTPTDSQTEYQVDTASAEICGADSGDVCYLKTSELLRVQNDPASFGALFRDRKAQFLSDLGPAFAGITEQGAALAFAGVVAYELKGYRAFGSIAPPPASWQLTDLLAAPELVCDEYVELALQLFYSAYPQTDASPLQINGVGWRRDSPTGNHAQLLVTGAGVNMLVDPDLGLVAPATLDSLLLHAPVASEDVFVRTDRADPVMQRFKKKVLNAVTPGRYDSRYLIYSFVAQDAGQAGGLKPYAMADDFTADVAAGPDHRFWYRTDDGAVWEINASGLKRAYGSGAAQVASGQGGGAVYVRMTDGSVSAFGSSGQWTPVASGITAIASGLGGNATLLLASSGDLWSAGAAGLSNIGAGFTAIATGQNGGGVYVLGSAGTVQVYNASGWIDLGRTDIAALIGEKSGQGVYVRTVTGDLYRINAFGTWDLLQQAVRDVVPGIGGLTLNILRFDGTAWQGDIRPGTGDWNTGTFVWTQLWSGDVYTGLATPDGGLTVQARGSDGRLVNAGASTF
jgi:hypothetical protein